MKGFCEAYSPPVGVALSLGKNSDPDEGLNSLVANEKDSDGVKEFEDQLVGVWEVC